MSIILRLSAKLSVLLGLFKRCNESSEISVLSHISMLLYMAISDCASGLSAESA